MIAKRIFDIVVSLMAICCLIVPSLIIIIFVVTGSRGGAFYRQERVGRNEKLFRLLKFRTMYSGSDKKGLLTVGSSDSRITSVGRFLRKTKIDELPQLLNIFVGHMSFVGPRPEVPKYTSMYNDQQRRVFCVKPGLTDLASIVYINESDLLGAQPDPEQFYIDVVMPSKLELNIQYIESRSFFGDLRIIFKTLSKLF
jgi:lipopolysaccharide/colanic/teichoic acid biosynthesis glycosyltransferase